VIIRSLLKARVAVWRCSYILYIYIGLFSRTLLKRDQYIYEKSPGKETNIYIFWCIYFLFDTLVLPQGWSIHVLCHVSLYVWMVSLGICVAVCCSVLQCVAVCCSVLQCVAVCCSVLLYGWSLLAFVL